MTICKSVPKISVHPNIRTIVIRNRCCVTLQERCIHILTRMNNALVTCRHTRRKRCNTVITWWIYTSGPQLHRIAYSCFNFNAGILRNPGTLSLLHQVSLSVRRAVISIFRYITSNAPPPIRNGRIFEFHSNFFKTAIYNTLGAIISINWLIA